MARDAAMRRHDEQRMREALELAVLGAGRTNPNPLVGAIIERDGRVLGRGYHDHLGGPHAEAQALEDCRRRGDDPRGATVYVTLEPCAHHGRQPPCADALAQAGVVRVVAGSSDPNPRVDGRGIARLRAAGVQVETGVLGELCDAINLPFLHYIRTGRPYVVAKWAMSADGRVACASGDSRWVSGGLSRAHAHALRNRLAAVMVGAGTVRADDPLLTCRLPGGRDPLRVVCDARLTAVTPDTRLVRTAGETPLLVAYVAPAGSDGAGEAGEGCAAGDPAGAARARGLLERAERLRAAGVQAVGLPAGPGGGVDLGALLAELGSREVDSVLLEGGPRLMASAFAAGVVDEVVAYLAPKVVGGAGAPGAVGGPGTPRMADAYGLSDPHVHASGRDVMVCWRAGQGVSGRDLPCASEQDLGPAWGRACADLAAGDAEGAAAPAAERSGADLPDGGLPGADSAREGGR